ncbi:hypothetical protein [Solidesulfovibrio magneticus]|uniref:Uncharacterized protein n=1 Tax=Solidesulfovibrio magneticus (strain ATCC 700980 / DSM 13731 / RS-1) TaxID=573370 RepID=C4XJF2_SOLM1|nr:hypothetical protein [Solidesulfovibrio magneticus]BAH76702.1 hypothetical protein DMR_32110 [Solidesulfovibrio magneticus RS-1]
MYVKNKCASCGATFVGGHHYRYCKSCYLGDKKFIESIFEEIDRKRDVPVENTVVAEKKCKENEPVLNCEASNLIENETSRSESSEVINRGAGSSVRVRQNINDIVAAYMKKSYLVHSK